MKFFLELEVDIDFDYLPERHGKYDGPPEFCYPSEPEELDIYSVRIAGTEVPLDKNWLHDQIIDQVRDEYAALKEDAILSKYEYKQEDAYA